MARMCELCGKKPATGHNVSHSNRRTKRRFLVNLQPLKVTNSGGNTLKIRACTGCLKTYNQRVLEAY